MIGDRALSAQDQLSLFASLGSAYIFGVGQLRPFVSKGIRPQMVERYYGFGYHPYFRF